MDYHSVLTLEIVYANETMTSKQKAPLEHSNFTEIVYEFYRNQFIFHTKKRMKKKPMFPKRA